MPLLRHGRSDQWRDHGSPRIGPSPGHPAWSGIPPSPPPWAQNPAQPAPSRPARRDLCGSSHRGAIGSSPMARHRLRGDHDPDRLIREDHRALFNAAASAAARSGLQSEATCSTAPAISILTIPASGFAATGLGAVTGSTTSGTNIGTLSPGRTSFPFRARPRHCERCRAISPYLSAHTYRPRHRPAPPAPGSQPQSGP